MEERVSALVDSAIEIYKTSEPSGVNLVVQLLGTRYQAFRQRLTGSLRYSACQCGSMKIAIDGKFCLACPSSL